MKIQEKKLEVSYTSVVILRIMLSLIFIVASMSHFRGLLFFSINSNLKINTP